jgi:predicted Zn-dependent protease
MNSPYGTSAGPARQSRKPACRRLPLAILFSCWAVAALCGCATTGPQGQQSFVLISTEQEVRIGAGVDQSIRQEFKVLADPKLDTYINQVGERVAVHADRKDVAYTFTVLNDDVVNAFAAPGGYIYITTGLLKAAHNEAEIAAVLGHVVGRHSVRKLQTAYGVGLATDLILGDRQTLQAIIGIATQVVLLKNSRDDEFEADEFGIKYAVAAGYDPQAMLSFFQTLLQLQGSASPSGLAGWFSTHPATEDRIQRGEDLLPGYRSPGQHLEIGQARFLEATASLR